MSRRDIERVTAVTGGGATDVVVVGWDPGVVANVTGNMAVVGWGAGVVANVQPKYSEAISVGNLDPLPGLPAAFFPVSQYVNAATGLVGTAFVGGYARAALHIVYVPRVVLPVPTKNQLILGILWSYDGAMFWAETAVYNPMTGTTATTFSGGPTLIEFLTTSGLGEPAQSYIFQVSIPAAVTHMRVIAFDGDAAAPGGLTACDIHLATI